MNDKLVEYMEELLEFFRLGTFDHEYEEADELFHRGEDLLVDLKDQLDQSNARKRDSFLKQPTKYEGEY